MFKGIQVTFTELRIAHELAVKEKFSQRVTKSEITQWQADPYDSSYFISYR